uniref:imidazolonepropionase n=1 Tax=Rhodobacteraceae bacterium 198 TaxID=290786 RepID=Q4W2U2_9RHOB|nr:imidazolone propionase HutI [Rhodobacteraceae bacterium 198]
MTERLILENLSVVTMSGDTFDTSLTENALIVAEDGIVSFVGKQSDYDGDRSGAIDMDGALCLPGLVACHNPCLWVGEVMPAEHRTAEGYRELTRQIAKTTKAADEATLTEHLAARLAALSRSGVTSCELKSGYGGDPETELVFAQLLSKFAATTKMRTRITLSFGQSFQGEGDPDEFLEHFEHNIVPASYEAGTPDAVEVFCDDDAALDLDMCSTILELYYKKKTPSRVACDRFEDSAGATLPVSFYSRCAIYLNKTEGLDLTSLSTVGTVAVIVPDTLNADYDQCLPDMQEIRDAGGRVALSSNAGPDGSGPICMLNALRAGRKHLGLTLDETLAAGTVHAAHALGISDEAGIIEKGRPADFSFFDATSLEALFLEDGPGCIATACSGHLTRH